MANGRTTGGDRREKRRREAELHTFEMDERLGSEIERSVKGAVFYDAPPKPRDGGRGVLPAVTVVDQDGVTAVLENGRGRADMCDLAILDFASFTNAGGGYDRGTMAQEESLCAESFLYNVLRRFDGWYAENRRHNINCALYRDRAIVVPKVRFEREKYHSYADVIVAAAPNARRARADYHLASDVLRRAMRDRIRLVLAVADATGDDQLVLGAYGCGVFGWDAETVAELLREELATGTHYATRVIVAIPRGRYDDNLDRFRHAFARFPEQNEDPYEPAPAPVPVPAKKAPEPEEDEGEEDWRKYL